ncbi:MAG: hypothetical protein HRU36_00390 [Rickettsiales bacterium]|nr:hypothetical protein [Rickettsiales bacterium]
MSKAKETKLNIEEIIKKQQLNEKQLHKIQEYQNKFNALQNATQIALEVLENRLLNDKNITGSFGFDISISSNIQNKLSLNLFSEKINSLQKWAVQDDTSDRITNYAKRSIQELIGDVGAKDLFLNQTLLAELLNTTYSPVYIPLPDKIMYGSVSSVFAVLGNIVENPIGVFSDIGILSSIIYLSLYCYYPISSLSALKVGSSIDLALGFLVNLYSATQKSSICIDHMDGVTKGILPILVKAVINPQEFVISDSPDNVVAIYNQIRNMDSRVESDQVDQVDKKKTFSLSGIDFLKNAFESVISIVYKAQGKEEETFEEEASGTSNFFSNTVQSLMNTFFERSTGAVDEGNDYSSTKENDVSKNSETTAISTIVLDVSQSDFEAYIDRGFQEGTTRYIAFTKSMCFSYPIKYLRLVSSCNIRANQWKETPEECKMANTYFKVSLEFCSNLFKMTTIADGKISEALKQSQDISFDADTGLFRVHNDEVLFSIMLESVFEIKEYEDVVAESCEDNAHDLLPNTNTRDSIPMLGAAHEVDEKSEL